MLDIILGLVLLWGAIMGYRRGFFREAAAFLGLVAGIYLAIIVADVTGRVVSGMVDWNPMPFKVVAFLTTFALVVAALWAIGASLTRLFKVILLNFFNRLFGMVFGVVKTALLISIAIFFLRILNESLAVLPDAWFSGSQIYRLLEGIAPRLFQGLALF